jgi:putative transposase
MKFGPLFAKELRRRGHRPTSRWHLDEMAVLIAGRRFWLWRAVDDEGEVLDLLVQRRRDKTAAVKTDAQADQKARLRARLTSCVHMPQRSPN